MGFHGYFNLDLKEHFANSDLGTLISVPTQTRNCLKDQTTNICSLKNSFFFNYFKNVRNKEFFCQIGSIQTIFCIKFTFIRDLLLHFTIFHPGEGGGWKNPSKM